MDHLSDTPLTEALVPKIDEAKYVALFLRSVEQKTETGAALSAEEMQHLYQLDVPIFERTRDNFNGWEESNDPAYIRKVKYREHQKVYREATLEALSEEHGADALWMLDSYDDFVKSMPFLIGTMSQPSLLVPHLKPVDLFNYKDALQAAGADIDIVALLNTLYGDRLFYEAEINLYVRENAAALKGEIEDDFIIIAFTEGGLSQDAAKLLLSIGIEHQKLDERFHQKTIEEDFDALLEMGFDPEQLIRRCSDEFITANIEAFVAIAPNAIKSSLMNPGYSKLPKADRIQRIGLLHAAGEDVEAYVKEFIVGKSFRAREAVEELVAVGVPIGLALDQLIQSDEMVVLINLDLFIENRVDPLRIKKSLSDYAILVRKDQLRQAGVDVVVAEHTRNIEATQLLNLWRDLKGEDIGETIDELFARYDGEMSDRHIEIFLAEGVDPSLVIAKLPDGSISNEDFYDSMLQRGVIETVLWPKLTDSLKLHMVTDSPEELEAELNRQASAEIARQSEYGLNRDLKKLIRTPEHANEVLEALKGSRLLQGNLKDLLTLGANPRAVFEIIEPKYAAGATKELVEAGIPIAEVFDAVKEQELSIGAVALLYKGGIPIEVIFDDNRLNMVGNYFSALVETGVDAKLLFDRAKDHMSSQFIKHRLGTFLEAGAPANELAEHMNAGDILECLPTLVEYSLDSSIIATALTEQYPGRSQDWYEEMIVKALLRR